MTRCSWRKSKADKGGVFSQDEVKSFVKLGNIALHARTSTDEDLEHARCLSDLLERIMQLYNYGLDSDDQHYYMTPDKAIYWRSMS